MLVQFGLAPLAPEWNSCVVCIGTFDGVHLGHQAVISTAVSQALELRQPSVLITFDRHPAAVLAPDKNPAAIATLGQKLRRFESLGVTVCLVLPFDERTSQIEAQAFLDDVLVAKLHANSIVVGHDFAFGKGRAGTPEWLAERMPTVVVPPCEFEGQRVSSTKIRSLIRAGDVATAEKLLGAPFSLGGVVVKGQQLGRQLGFPTVNVARLCDQILPADGVYAGRCETVHGEFRAAISVGHRRTGTEPCPVEAFLIDYQGDSLYGTVVELQFASMIREQRDFDDLDALAEQIRQDVATIENGLGI